jgi:signal transduction histidine kinase/CheY-like chemotaxis protein
MVPSVSAAAARGESLEKLLDNSAALLMERSGADRAGVWAGWDMTDPVWTGKVLQEDESAILQEWQTLKPFGLFPMQIAGSAGALQFTSPCFPAGPAGFFDGMESALWLPIESTGDLLGGALLTARRSRDLVRPETLAELLGEIAAALSLFFTRERLGRTQRAQGLREALDQSIASGADSRQALSLIAASSARDTRAEFLGLAHRGGEDIRWSIFSGSESRAVACDSALREVAASLRREGHLAMRIMPPNSGVEISVVGLSLAAEQADSLLLLAGYRNEDIIPLERLHSLAALVETVRVATEARETESAYRALLESSTDAILVVDSAGEVKGMSRRARELFCNKKDSDSPPPLVAFFRDPGADEIRTWLRNRDAHQTAGTLECTLRSGSKVRLSLRSVFGGGPRLLVAIEEGSVVHRAERRANQLEAELCSVLDAVRSGVLLVDSQGRVRHTNARFGLFFGIESRTLETLESYDDIEALVGSRFRDPRAFGAPWRAFLGGEDHPRHEELELSGASGRVFERYARPVVDDSGVRLGWLEIYRDITNQRHIQSKLLQTEKMAALGQLVSGIAHELNNPLTSIMGYAQLLLGRGAPEASSGEAKMIFEEAERARRIVKNLLFFSRQTEPERTRVDVNEIVERTISLRGYELKIENIALSSQLEPDLPSTLADPYQLQQITLNLLVNAEQAILQGRGHGRIEVSTRKTEEGRIIIEVTDDGPGVPPEIATRIFDPFFTTKPSGVGTGLGLSIVYGIVEQHGGEVAFENLRGGGARFSIELPIIAVQPESLRSAPGALLHAVGEREHATARVLVVEDEPTVAQLIADVLREEGHRVDTVLDSQEGLTRVARQHFDLVICDLRMPRLDGPAFYDALVRSGSQARHRILFITGDTLGPHTIEFLKSRQLPFLAKPFLVEELKLAVSRVLKESSEKIAGALASAHGRG